MIVEVRGAGRIPVEYPHQYCFIIANDLSWLLYYLIGIV